MSNIYDISIIGSGNVAWHLGPALENAGHRIHEVYSPTSKNALALVKRLYNASPNPNLDFSKSEANVFIIAVADDAIPEVAQSISLPAENLLLHTSGSVPLSALGYAPSNNLGVLYPVQTFTKQRKVDFRQIPLLYEGEGKIATRVLKDMAKSLSKNITQVNYQQRIALHVSAVMACNLTNHLQSIATSVLKYAGLNEKIIQPLIKETVEKSMAIGPAQAQTGPAARGDMETLERHMEWLNNYDAEVAELYKRLTQHILDNK